MNSILQDKNLILSLGGPTKVAALLGLDKTAGGVQRVQNWMSRGIPPKEKLARPDLFLPGYTQIAEPPRRRRKADQTEQNCKNDN